MSRRASHGRGSWKKNRMAVETDICWDCNICWLPVLSILGYACCFISELLTNYFILFDTTNNRTSYLSSFWCLTFLGDNLMQQSVSLLQVKDPLFKRMGASRIARFAIDGNCVQTLPARFLHKFFFMYNIYTYILAILIYFVPSLNEKWPKFPLNYVLRTMWSTCIFI